ncbi:LacI family DNA-binding transcriptional regulator [Burkholderia sp. Ac-20353]|uniref:LacI family DNA-binding transcriptional regulator n=1 Tax=Burkholderia sp. Ac-20353 TaxID=2703894 RepID=UPI00197BB76F|nr:LacI family DNA-binding transcriptional regulator [Burkholderia sp. Ac-20353]MBN3786434.1 LacI family transcriptional regulator [Burkholderia sp. Ac-20353]
MKDFDSPRPTLEDVARLAGVSLGSASRALSVPDQVKPKTLALVKRAVEQLGYVSNGAARALASRKTRTIGAIYPTMHNPAFVQSLDTLQRTLWDFNYQVVLASHEYNPEREYDVVKAVVERGVDGVVLVGTAHEDRVFDLMRQRRIPLVLTWENDEPRYGECIHFDNRQATYLMTKEVLKRGHERIATICGSLEHNKRARQRVAGIADAMKEAGLELDPDCVIEEPFSIEGGRDGVRRVIAMDKRPTVLICHTDLQAIGALHECGEHGIRVPEDMSITGMDDIELAAIMKPPLTTIRVPTREIGVLAARRIVGLAEKRTFDDPQAVAAEIVLRDSLGDVPASVRRPATPRRTRKQA